MKRGRLRLNGQLWSLLDQALVSGTNFVGSVVLARSMGVEVFGTYVVAQAYLLYANTFQSALVVSPMMTAVPAESDPAVRQSLLCGFFGYAALVVVFTTLVVQALAAGLGRWVSAVALGDLALPLTAAMVGFQLQDWLRRALFTRSAHQAVFVSDLLAYGGQLSVLGWLAWSGWLSPSTALWTLAGAFALAAVLTATFARLAPEAAATLEVVRAHWRASRDFLASWQLQWLASSGVILVGTGFIGVQAAGAIRAAQNLLGPVNVLFQWMDNIVPVRCANQYRAGGRRALEAYLRQVHWGGLAVLGLITVAAYTLDEWLMTRLYGDEYRPFAALVTLQALYYLLGHSYRVHSYANRTLGNTGLLARASLWWAIAALGSAVVLVGAFAERGIMSALVLGEATAVAYLVLVRRSQQPNTSRSPVAHTRLVLPNNAALLLPVASAQLARGTLRMYFPSRWLGRLYRAVLSAAAPAWVRLVPQSAAAPPGWCPHLSTVLASVPGARAEWVGGLQAAEGPRAKLTLRIMGRSGQAMAYARIATGPAARAVVENEARVLSVLGNSALARQVPKLMDHGHLVNPDAYYLVEAAGPDDPLMGDLTEGHFAFLGALVERDGAWRRDELRGVLELDSLPMLDEVPDATSIKHQVHGMLDALPTVTPPCIEHGDFAPWNLRRLSSGLPFAIDWEHGQLRGVPWLDALHFRFQLATMVRRRSPGRVVVAMLQTFEMRSAREYLRLSGIGSECSRPIVAIYLVRALAVGRAEGLGLDSIVQRHRLEALRALASMGLHNGR